MIQRPIIIVEDDSDDCIMITEALKAIGIRNEFRCFDTPVLALRYLRSTSEAPLIIISDIRMPFMSGIEFKAAINADEFIKKKHIPFVFLTTSAAQKDIDEAFEVCSQGYFQKPNNVNNLKYIAKSIIDYWLTSKLPNNRA